MYLYVILLLVAAEIIYLLLAKRFDFIAVKKETPGSSNTRQALKGAGIVFWMAALLYAVFNPSELAWWFLAGITLIALVGFWDDAREASTWARLLLHLAAASIAFHVAGVFEGITWWNVAVAYVGFIGMLYAFKFMDHIHGMTGLYALAVLLPLLYINHYMEPFAEEQFLAYPIFAASVFLIFNLGSQSVTGDVGSLSIASWIALAIVMLIAKTGEWVWIGLLMVYGVDTIMTLGHGTFARKPLLKREKLHFYQVLADELRLDDRLVASIYAVLQLGLSTLLIAFYPTMGTGIFWILLGVLVLAYLAKFRILRVVKHLERR